MCVKKRKIRAQPSGAAPAPPLLIGRSFQAFWLPSPPIKKNSHQVQPPHCGARLDPGRGLRRMLWAPKTRASWLFSRDCVQPRRAAPRRKMETHKSQVFDLLHRTRYTIRMVSLVYHTGVQALRLCGSQAGTAVQQQPRYNLRTVLACVCACVRCFSVILHPRNKGGENGFASGIPRMGATKDAAGTHNSSQLQKQPQPQPYIHDALDNRHHSSVLLRELTSEIWPQ